MDYLDCDYWSKYEVCSYHNLKRYLNIISYIVNLGYRNLDRYEKHHIVPKSFDKSLITDNNNLIILTCKEHYIIHKILANCFTGIYGRSMKFAFHRMTNNKNFKINNYDKKFANKILREAWKNYWSDQENRSYQSKIHSIKMKEAYINNPNLLEIRRDSMLNNKLGEGNTYNRGRIYITNDNGDNLRIYPDEYNRYELIGYHKGMTKNSPGNHKGTKLLFENKEFISIRDLTNFLKSNRYPRIGKDIITSISKGNESKRYPELNGMITVVDNYYKEGDK